jgi:hypothetical protein
MMSQPPLLCIRRIDTKAESAGDVICGEEYTFR